DGPVRAEEPGVEERDAGARRDGTELWLRGLIDVGPSHCRSVAAADGPERRLRRVVGAVLVPAGVLVREGKEAFTVAAGGIRQGLLEPRVALRPRVQSLRDTEVELAASERPTVVGRQRWGVDLGRETVEGAGGIATAEEGTPPVLRALGEEGVERTFEAGRLLGADLERAEIRVDGAVEDERAHLCREQLGVEGAE